MSILLTSSGEGEAPAEPRLAGTLALPRSRARRGFWIADALIGMTVISIVSVVLVVAVNQQQRGRERLADSRAALRLAEETLAKVQNGQSPPAAPSGATIQLRRVDGMPPTGGQVWIEVRVGLRGRSATLQGLAPPTALPASAGGQP